MKKNNLLILCFLFVSISFSQIKSSITEFTFPQTLVNSKDSITLYIINKCDTTLLIKANNFTKSFYTPDSILILNSNDSTSIKIYYKPTTNVEDKDIFVFKAENNYGAAVINIKGIAKYGDNYDATTYNKYDVELKNALSTLVSNHNSLGYNTARDRMFENIDKLPGDTIECVYTGKKIKASTRTEAQNKGFNTEHTWPQSFFSENEPMKSDINHLYPTDEPPNSARSNYPFGTVVSGITYNVGGSKLGRNSKSITVFEPRNEHKGNVSRSMFYFILRYPSNYGSFLNIDQENEFRNWNKIDPVDSREISRNDGIMTYQWKRNPLIDHPDFIDRIYSFVSSNTAPKIAKLNYSPTSLIFRNSKINQPNALTLYIYNSGNKLLNITGGSVTGNGFSGNISPTTINDYSYTSYQIIYTPQDTNINTGTVSVQSNEGNITINLIGSTDKTTGIHVDNSVVSDFTLSQNYPNPFNPLTTISYQIPIINFVTLKIYDVLGREVATLVNELQKPGNYSVQWDASNFTSGIYYYELFVGDGLKTSRMIKKMILLR